MKARHGMMLVPKDRMWITVTGLLLVTATGAAGGYLLGRAHLEKKAEAELISKATRLQAMLETTRIEGGALLVTLNTSSYSACSDAELTWFRQLILHSVTFRDAGRMRDGRMECSAAFGRGSLPETRLQPNSSLSDGTSIYWNPAPYTNKAQTSYLMQAGNFYVASDPNLPERMKMITRDYETYLWGGSSRGWVRATGLQPKLSAAIASHDGQGIVEDTLFGTHCSVNRISCAVAYGSLTVTLEANRWLLLFYAAFGALFGALLVLVYLVIHWHGRSMAQQLRRAIRQDKLHMLYQPIVDLHSRRVVGAEALARWTDEDGYMVSPEVFVRLSEERGFVGELTRLVVRHALRDFHQLLQENPDFQLHVNITATDLVDASFLPMLEDSLARAGVAPRSLALEVTESSTASTPVAIEAIRLLRERGHSIKIDDFGTGYSSLAYLKDLAVDTIKIDRAFVRAIGTEAVMEGILPQILAMAESLKLGVVIEGIETLEQEKYFADTGKPMLGQGWLYGYPVPIDQFEHK